MRLCAICGGLGSTIVGGIWICDAHFELWFSSPEGQVAHRIFLEGAASEMRAVRTAALMKLFMARQNPWEVQHVSKALPKKH